MSPACLIDKRNAIECRVLLIFVVNNKEMGYNCT